MKHICSFAVYEKKHLPATEGALIFNVNKCGSIFKREGSLPRSPVLLQPADAAYSCR